MLVRITRLREGGKEPSSVNPEHVVSVGKSHPESIGYREDAGNREPECVTYLRFVHHSYGWVVLGTVEEITALLNGETKS